MIKNKVLIALAPTALIFSIPVHSKSIHKEFAEAWEQRDLRYYTNFESLVDTANKAIASYQESLGDPEADSVEMFKIAMGHVRSAQLFKGRGTLLSQFREYIKKKPSAARSELWMQEEIENLQREREKLDQFRLAMEGLPEDAALNDRVEAIQNWVQQNGYVLGMSEELSLIDQNLASYHKARTASDQRRRAARAAFLGGLGRSLQESSNFDDFPTITRCNSFGSSTTCISD